jgi:hypothetical protein
VEQLVDYSPKVHGISNAISSPCFESTRSSTCGCQPPESSHCVFGPDQPLLNVSVIGFPVAENPHVVRCASHVDGAVVDY